MTKDTKKAPTPGEVTYFNRLLNTTQPEHFAVVEILDRIRAGEVQETIEAIRMEVDPIKKRAIKNSLPIACFSGKFNKRSEAGMDEHSGLMCIDLDKIPADVFASERDRLKADPHTFALFTSPSGNGLKLLVQVPRNKDQHRDAFKSVVEYVDSPYTDPTTSDPARACFLSWDPDLYLNKDAEVFIPTVRLVAPVEPSEAELDGITKRALARICPTIERPAGLLDKLLASIEKVDFRERAELFDEEAKLARKHFQVCSIQEVLDKARANNWDLCKNAAFTYVFNGAYWVVVAKDELQQFLGHAAELMGVDKFDSLHYVFMGQLYQQFLATASLPIPAPNEKVVLVNLKNGTYEIGTDKQFLRPASAADFLTYQLPFDYDPKAKAPMFQAYLDRVQPDVERQHILAECVAYLFVNTASLKIEKVPLLYGTGANGKSVFFEVVNALVGGSTNVSYFTPQQLTDDSGYYRAMIANKLVNYSSEINGKMNTDMFKALASGEPVSARLPYGEPFNISRYAKLMFNCNELPRDVEQTDAFFRRFLLIPFDVTIPENERDLKLSSKIIEAELSGVFNWVLDGLTRLLQQEGFTECQAVNDALQQYRKRSDSVLGFIEDYNLKPSASETKPLMDLYHQYKVHCVDSGSRPCGRNTFSERLRANGYNIERRNSGRVVWVETGDEKENVF